MYTWQDAWQSGILDPVCIFPRDNQNKLSSTMDMANLLLYDRWLDHQFKNLPPWIAQFPCIFFSRGSRIRRHRIQPWRNHRTSARIGTHQIWRLRWQTSCQNNSFCYPGLANHAVRAGFSDLSSPTTSYRRVLDGHFGQAFMNSSRTSREWAVIYLIFC